MSIRSLSRSTVIALPLLTVSASGGWAEGYYLKAFGGISYLSDTDITISGAGTDPDVSFDSGFAAGAAVGYAFSGLPVSAELEWTYRSGDSKTGTTSGGDFASTSLMLNGIWSSSQTGRFSPYLGAGLGFLTEIDFDVLSGSAAGEYSDRGGFAFQVFGGVSYAVTERVSAYTELRYFDAGSVDLEGPGGATLQADYSALDVLAGVSFSF